MDITYIPMARGFVYLAVVLDWFSRRVLSWRLSITMEAAFCVETLEDALARHSKPEIFNTDQGSQFTGAAFTGVLIKNGIAISMANQAWLPDRLFLCRFAHRAGLVTLRQTFALKRQSAPDGEAVHGGGAITKVLYIKTALHRFAHHGSRAGHDVRPHISARAKPSAISIAPTSGPRTLRTPHERP